MSTVTWLNEYGFLSTLLIPLTIILYIFVHPLRPAFFKAMVAIGVIGTIEVISAFYTNKYPKSIQIGQNIKISSLFILIIALISHLLILVVLIDFSKYWGFNKFSLLILVVANLVIIFLPWWPYNMSKTSLLIVYNVVYLTIFGFGYLLFNN